MNQERVVVVTGAAGGIGQAIAKAFAHSGYRLYLGDLQPCAVNQYVSSKDSGSEIFAGILDVTSEDSVHRLFEDALRQFGRIDVLVNAAGVTSFGAARELALAEWERVMRINLTGTFLCCQAALASMATRRFGRIINIGSVVGKNGGNARPWLDPGEQLRMSNVAYGVSKAGVHTLTTFLAREFADRGITVNAVAPGPIASPMTRQLPEDLIKLIPVGRLGQAEEVAHACLYLASDRASYVTGEILDLNGGLWSD